MADEGLEKYGVVTPDPQADPHTKLARSLKHCPQCGSRLTESANVKKCPKCGTGPFEGAPNAEETPGR